MINHLQSVKQCQNKQIHISNYLHSIPQLHCAGIVLIKHTHRKPPHVPAVGHRDRPRSLLVLSGSMLKCKQMPELFYDKFGHSNNLTLRYVLISKDLFKT